MKSFGKTVDGKGDKHQTCETRDSQAQRCDTYCQNFTHLLRGVDAITCKKDSDNPTSIVTASMRSAVGVEVLKVDLRPREEVSAHWEAEDRGLPRTSRLGEYGGQDGFLTVR